MAHNKAHSPTVTMVKLLSDFSILNDVPYLSRKGKVWGVFHQFFKAKWRWYSESALYYKIRLDSGMPQSI